MKKLLLALALFLAPAGAFAQCNGIVPNNYACGNISGGPGLLQPIPLSSFPANAPGGATGDIQTNGGGGTFGFIHPPGTTNTFLRGDGTFSALPSTAIGAWTNIRLAKTAAYTTASADCGSTLALGGSAFYAATFNAPSGYTSTCAFVVSNEDRGAGFATLSTVSTSATSITIGTGSKAFTTSAGLTFSTAQRYRVYSLANSSNYMSGYATYASTTFTLTADTTSGSGTFTDWQIAPEIENPGRAKLLLPQFATSSTSTTIGTGAKSFTTSSGLTILGGYQRYRVYSLANTANWMAGTATYIGTTLTITVDATSGSGTFTDWQIAPEIRLWPGQSRLIYNQNNVWFLDPPSRWLLPNTRELCVAQNGSDSNDGFGLGSGCLAKIQTALNIIGQEWDGTGYYACNIGLYSGGTNTFTEAASQTGQSVGCYLTINVRSNLLTWTSTTNCISFGDNAILIFDSRTMPGFTFTCNTSNTATNAAFYFHQTGILDIFGATIAWIPGGANDNFLFVDAQGRATMAINSLAIGDGAARTFNAVANCDANCAAVNWSGQIACSANVTYGKTFIAYGGSLINTTASYAGCTGGTASISSGNSKIITNGTSIQGGTTTAGTGGAGMICTTKC